MIEDNLVKYYFKVKAITNYYFYGLGCE